MVNQRHARAGSGDLILKAEGAGRRVRIHHENEVEEASFADGRFCGGSGSRPLAVRHRVRLGSCHGSAVRGLQAMRRANERPLYEAG